MSAHLASFILTLALIIPNTAQESRNSAIPGLSGLSLPALEAPKTPFLSMEEYAAGAAQKHDLDETRFQRLIECESRWKEDAAGDQGTSLGILQFKTTTFAQFTKKYGLASYDISDPNHQIDLAARMIGDGYLHHWKNCARKIGWSRSDGQN